MLLAISSFTLAGLIVGFALWLGLIAYVARMDPPPDEPENPDGPADD